MDPSGFGSGWLDDKLSGNLNALLEILPIRNSLGLQASFIKMQIHLRGL